MAKHNIKIIDYRTHVDSSILIDLHEDNLDGILIKNILSEEELSSIKSNLSTIAGNQYVEMTSGCTLPRVFATAQDYAPEGSVDLKDYFQNSDRIKQLFPKMLGVNIQERLDHLLKSLSNGMKVSTPKGINDVGSYTPFSIRIIFPNMGALPLHKDEKFLGVNEYCKNHMAGFLNRETQASFFILVSAPESEGSLRFFDDSETVNTELFTNNPNVKEKKAELVEELNPGDMIIFLSSKISHQVDDFGGMRNRITIGGYTALSQDETQIYYWS